MDQKTFLNKLTASSGIDKATCSVLIKEFAEIVGRSLINGEIISIPSFGSIESRKRKERIISHPSSPKKRMLVPPKLVVTFKPSAILKNKINNISQSDEQ